MRRLRILGRIITEMVLDFQHSGWSSWLVVSILVIALTIFGGVLQLTVALNNLVSSWGSQLEISAYLKDTANPRQIADQISRMPGVRLVEIVPKQVAWEKMQKSFKVASLTNPLPNTLHVQLVSVGAVGKTAARLKLVEEVEHIRYPLQVAKNLNRLRHFLELAGVVVTAALTAATLMVIGNTIQLVVQSRDREIEILSLMGVSPWYIKGPLVLQGASYGALSALIATGLIWCGCLYFEYYVADQFVGVMAIVPSNVSYGMVPTLATLLLLGLSVGAIGSAWTSGRFIKI